MTKETETAEKVTLFLKEGETSVADVEEGRADDENPDADEEDVEEKPEVDGNCSAQKMKGTKWKWPPASSGPSKRKHRKWKEEYVKYGLFLPRDEC